MEFLQSSLRVWVGVVGCVAMLNAAQCYWNTATAAERIYTLEPLQATPLFSRMFANWTLLAGVVRVVYALTPSSHGLHTITLFSFLLALGHFVTETMVTGTAGINVGTVSPFIISSLSIVWMLVAWPKSQQGKDRTD